MIRRLEHGLKIFLAEAEADPSGTMSKHPPLIPIGGSEPLMNMGDVSEAQSSNTKNIPTPEFTFNRSRQITYWLRCARTFLPNAYESGDASRMLFAFFIVSALDLLGMLDPDPETGKAKITSEEKSGWIDWIYHCQHSEGGFRGFTGTIMDHGEQSSWDPANLPATFFALCTLLILGDDLRRVDREACLKWTAKLQRPDGSFGEVLSGEVGLQVYEIQGGRDLRFCCCAAGIMYMLRNVRGLSDATTMFKEGAMVHYIESCQSYEGGFSEGPYREAHSGLNYCAIGALSFLSTLSPRGNNPPELVRLEEAYREEIDLSTCIKWMLLRQTTYIEDDEYEASSDADVQRISQHAIQTPTTIPQDGSLKPSDLLHAGFNGRTNKIADTCYAFWNFGALAILKKQHLVDQDRLRRYLLAKVQHRIGGFGKGVGEPPDVLHAYLGLATLSIIGKDGLKPIDPTLCISIDAAERIARLSWKK